MSYEYNEKGIHNIPQAGITQVTLSLGCVHPKLDTGGAENRQVTRWATRKEFVDPLELA